MFFGDVSRDTSPVIRQGVCVCVCEINNVQIREFHLNMFVFVDSVVFILFSEFIVLNHNVFRRRFERYFSRHQARCVCVCVR